jgi:hypothetical protein
MRIDQRNAGVAQTFTAGSNAYTVDRWFVLCTGANVTGQQVAGAAANQYRYQLTGAAGVTGITFAQRIEALNCADFAGKTVTLSVDLSNSLLSSVSWALRYANATDNWTSNTLIANGAFTGITGTSSRKSIQIDVPSAATGGLMLQLAAGALTSGTVTIGNVQLEEGTVATPFERRSYGQELALCQRYYQVFTSFSIEGYANAGNTRAVTVPVFFPVQMRATPTRAVITAGAFTNVRGSSTAYAGLGLNGLTTTYASASAEATGAGLCQYINATESMSAEL